MWTDNINPYTYAEFLDSLYEVVVDINNELGADALKDISDINFDDFMELVRLIPDDDAWPALWRFCASASARASSLPLFRACAVLPTSPPRSCFAVEHRPRHVPLSSGLLAASANIHNIPNHLASLTLAPPAAGSST